VTALIVDDEENNRNIVRKLLRLIDADVQVLDEADSVPNAFQKIHEKKPDLVFLDIRLYNQTANDLLKQFKSIDFSIIFISAHRDDGYVPQYPQSQYLLKPLDPDDLSQAIHKLQNDPAC
jgi:two-component system LytT family response regulator